MSLDIQEQQSSSKQLLFSGEILRASSLLPTAPTRRQFRNAEIIQVPQKVSTIAAMAAICDCCGVYNVLYEVVSSNNNNNNTNDHSSDEDENSDGSEWCDSSRRVCVLYEGEVVASGLTAVASCFGLKMKKVSMNMKLNQTHDDEKNGNNNKKSNQKKKRNNKIPHHAGFFPSILLDPSKWKTNENYDNSKFRVFVSGESPNVGSRRIKPGSHVLILKSDSSLVSSNDENNNISTNRDKNLSSSNIASLTQMQIKRRRARSAAANSVGGKQNNNNTKKINDDNAPPSQQELQDMMLITLLRENPNSKSTNQITIQDNNNSKFTKSQKEDPDDDEETFIDDMMYRILHNPHPLSENFPNQHQIFCRDTLWSRIHDHAIFSTFFVSGNTKHIENDNARLDIPSMQNRQFFQQQHNRRPQRRVLALCSIGMPDCEVLNQLAEKLTENTRNEDAEPKHRFRVDNGAKDLSIVFFLDLPTLHAASKKYVLNQLARIQDEITNNFLTPLQLRLTAQQRGETHQESTGITVSADVIVTCASRFVSSPVRFPEKSLFQKLFVREVRGGEEVLDSASLMVSLNSDLMCSWLIEKFARVAITGGGGHTKILEDDVKAEGNQNKDDHPNGTRKGGMPFVKVNDFLEDY